MHTDRATEDHRLAGHPQGGSALLSLAMLWELSPCGCQPPVEPVLRMPCERRPRCRECLKPVDLPEAQDAPSHESVPDEDLEAPFSADGTAVMVSDDEMDGTDQDLNAASASTPPVRRDARQGPGHECGTHRPLTSRRMIPTVASLRAPFTADAQRTPRAHARSWHPYNPPPIEKALPTAKALPVSPATAPRPICPAPTMDRLGSFTVPGTTAIRIYAESTSVATRDRTDGRLARGAMSPQAWHDRAAAVAYIAGRGVWFRTPGRNSSLKLKEYSNRPPLG